MKVFEKNVKIKRELEGWNRWFKKKFEDEEKDEKRNLPREKENRERESGSKYIEYGLKSEKDDVDLIRVF